jgi:hypothetical protein
MIALGADDEPPRDKSLDYEMEGIIYQGDMTSLCYGYLNALYGKIVF